MHVSRLSFTLSRSMRNLSWKDASSFSKVAGPGWEWFHARKTHSTIRKARTPKRKAATDNCNTLMLYMKEKTAKKCSYVFEESLANRLGQSIISNRDNPKAPVLEISPGIGLVSKALLEQGVERVVALETEKHFYSYLKVVQEQYGKDKFEFHNWNILNIYDKFNDWHPKENGNMYRMSEALIRNGLSRSAFYETDTPYSLFTLGGSRENHNLIFYILRNMPTEDPILSKGRVEFFFLVHPKFKLSVEEIQPTDQPSSYTRYYSYFHTFISLMYDIKFIDEFEASDFVPPFSKNGSTKKMNAHKRHLVKLQLKADINKILPLDHHYAFSIFLRHVFRKRKIRIVPVMEMLVSGCGLHMLAQGFTMLDTVVDISPQRLLQLYKCMLDWPEYSVSHLKNHIIMKTQGGPMEEDDII